MSFRSPNSVFLVASGAAIFAATMATVRAEELRPFIARSIALDSVRGVVYFMPGRDDDKIFATLDSHEGPFRLVAPLRPGQKLELSRPGPAGETPSLIEISREGDKVLVAERPRATPADASTFQEDFLSGP